METGRFCHALFLSTLAFEFGIVCRAVGIIISSLTNFDKACRYQLLNRTWRRSSIAIASFAVMGHRQCFYVVFELQVGNYSYKITHSMTLTSDFWKRSAIRWKSTSHFLTIWTNSILMKILKTKVDDSFCIVLACFVMFGYM